VYKIFDSDCIDPILNDADTDVSTKKLFCEKSVLVKNIMNNVLTFKKVKIL
jgi:hypothetical protein